MSSATFTIPGIPRPQGSLRIVTSRSTGRAFAKNSDTTSAHRNHVVACVSGAWAEQPPITGAVEVVLLFVLPRPAGHWGTGRNSETLKPSAPVAHTQPADADKLARLVNDALVLAGVLVDDAQVNRLVATKRWTTSRHEQPRTEVVVRW